MVNVRSAQKYHFADVERSGTVDGYVGNFTVTIRKETRYVDELNLHWLRVCQEKCPKKVIDEVFEAGLGLSQGDLYSVPAGRAQLSGHRS